MRNVSPASLVARGLLLLERSRAADHDEAGRLFHNALRADPDLAEAHAGVARSATFLYTTGMDESPERLQEALEESERAAALAPDDAGIRMVRALALAAADRLTPALAEAERTATLAPDRMEGHLALCIVKRLQRDLDAAIASCRRAAEIAPDAPRVLLALAEALRESGAWDAARNLFGQAADLQNDSPLPQLGAAATLARSGAFSIAARGYKLVLERFPDVRLRALQGAAGARVSGGDYEGALDLFQEIDLPDDAALPTLLSLYAKGYALLKLDRAAEAEYFLSLVVSRVPADYDGPARGRDMLFLAYDALADWHAGRGRPERALALLREAAGRRLAPTRMARRAAPLLQERGKESEAAGLLERALVAADPGEDRIEIADSALLLARLRSSEGRRAIPKDSPTGRALDAAARRVDAKAPAAACYRMARAYGLARDAEASLSFLGRSRDGGYMPSEQAATDPAFTILRQRPEFRRFLETGSGNDPS
jgi:tetratricopeptide (TPR) repeat protein